MNIVIYDKKSLEVIARPVIANLEEFKEKPFVYKENMDIYELDRKSISSLA